MKLSFVMSLFAFLGLNCTSQPTPEKALDNNTLLWQITGNGLKQPSYFFGTMHILCSEDATISKNFNTVINKVGQVYFEIDMDDLGQMFGGMSAMNMLDGKKLKDLYTEAEYEKVKSWFDAHGQLPFNMIDGFKPLLLSSMVEEDAMACPQKDGMEMRIMELVNKRKLEIKGLETMSFQAGIIDSIPYEEQAKELLESIDSVGTQKKQMQQLVAEYKGQNLDSIDALTKSEEGGVSKYLDLMLYNRNRNWVKQFDAIAQEKSTLFAVGAGHLPGDNGVLNLLRKKGYTLTPMKN
ncbi:MAG: TraB/GumN family protein [Chitinophagaceae bacterium]